MLNHRTAGKDLTVGLRGKPDQGYTQNYENNAPGKL
jgi:hypothetical protein